MAGQKKWTRDRGGVAHFLRLAQRLGLGTSHDERAGRDSDEDHAGERIAAPIDWCAAGYERERDGRGNGGEQEDANGHRGTIARRK
jgi:hypothetical protein